MIMRTPFGYSKLLFIMLLALSLGAWKGPLRDQDLKVYRLSMPVLLDAQHAAPEGSDSGVPRWRVVRVLPQPQLVGTRDRFGVEVQFARLAGDGQVSVNEVKLRSYLVEPTGIQVVEAPPADLSGTASQGVLFDPKQSVLSVRGERYGYRSAFVDEPGTVSTAPALSHFNSLGEKEFLAIETLGDSGQQFVTLVRLPSTEAPSSTGKESAPVREADGRPLVDLQSLQFPHEVGGMALMEDGKTIVLVSGDAFDQSETGTRELWLVRLPGTLRTSPVPVYILSALVVLLSLGLLVISLWRRNDLKRAQPAHG